MGLDIIAFSRIIKIACTFDSSGEPISPDSREPLDLDNCVQLYVNDDFPGRANEIEHRAVYGYHDSLHVSAGSYSAYNQWRDELAKLAGWPKGQYEEYGGTRESYCVECWDGAEGAFSELICFSDCEGVIGTAVSKKLAADFESHQSLADDHPEPIFQQKYAKLRAAFELASDAGCVKFC